MLRMLSSYSLIHLGYLVNLCCVIELSNKYTLVAEY